MKVLFTRSLLMLCVLLLPLTAYAQPIVRGVQANPIDVLGMDSTELASFKNDYNINLFTLFISSSNTTFQPSTEQQYIDFLEDELVKVDSALAVLKSAGYRVIIAFAAPPGFFETSASQTHSKMFSNATFQSYYVNMIVSIVNRYAQDTEDPTLTYSSTVPAIFGLDILTEPADFDGEPNNGAKDWIDENNINNSLFVDVIGAVRAVSNVRLFVKSLYGTGANLKRLKYCFNSVDNVFPAFNPYDVSPKYMHSNIPGFNAPPFQVSRPGSTKIFNKTIGEAAKLTRWMSNNCGLVDGTTIPYHIGEWTAPPCADEAEIFAQDMSEIFERADLSTAGILKTVSECRDDKSDKIALCNGKSGKKKKNCKQKAKQSFSKCKKKAQSGGGSNSGGGNKKSGKSGENTQTDDIRFLSTTLQSVDGTPSFDPRNSCSNSGTLTFVGNTAIMQSLLQNHFVNNNQFSIQP